MKVTLTLNMLIIWDSISKEYMAEIKNRSLQTDKLQGMFGEKPSPPRNYSNY